MKLTLQRKWTTDKSTIGELCINGAFECFVLEDKLRAPGVKVPGQTAISAGTYQVALTYSNRFKVIMPLLINVPNFAGIRIHPGNSPVNTAGCLLVGRTRGADWIGESRAAYARLYNQLARVVGKERVEIEIINPPGWQQSSIAARIAEQEFAEAFQIRVPSLQAAQPGVGVAAVTPSAPPTVAPSATLPPAQAAASVTNASAPALLRSPLPLVVSFARLLPFLSTGLAGAANFYQQYKWPLWCIAAAVVSFWAGWHLRPPERKST